MVVAIFIFSMPPPFLPFLFSFVLLSFLVCLLCSLFHIVLAFFLYPVKSVSTIFFPFSISFFFFYCFRFCLRPDSLHFIFSVSLICCLSCLAIPLPRFLYPASFTLIFLISRTSLPMTRALASILLHVRVNILLSTPLPFNSVMPGPLS